MPEPAAHPPCEPIWTAIRAEAWSEDERDPILRKFLKETILKSRQLEDALSLQLSAKLGTEYVYPMILPALIDQAFAAAPTIRQALRDDLDAVRDRDPASRGFLAPFLYFKGFQAL